MATGAPDERDQDVVTYKGFTGVRNDVQAERFGISDLMTAINCNLDKSGQISRRDGFTNQVAGAAHSLWSNDIGTLALAATGGWIKQLNADYSLTSLVALADPAARISFHQVNESIYFSNGTDKGVLQNGAVRTWGVAVPPMPAVTLIDGDMPAGTYQYAMTYGRSDGQESGATLAGVVEVPAGSGLLFSTQPSADPAVVWNKVYLTTANGDELYLALTYAGAEVSWGYTWDTSELNLPLDTQFLQPPPAGQLVAYYRGRMFVAVGDTLYPSEPFAYELFDYRNYLQFDSPITLLAPMEDKERGGTAQSSGFFVGTERSCGVLVGSAPSDFQYVAKTAYGAVLGAMDMVDGSVFGDNSLGARPLPMWLTTQGICIGKPDMQIENLTRTKFGFAAGGQGAAIFMPGPNRFIASSNF